MLLSILVFAHVLGAVNPRFFTLALLYIVYPLTLIPRAVNVRVDTLPVGLVCFEIANIDVALSVPESASALSFIIDPFSFVNSSIDPLLYSIPASLLFWFLTPMIVILYQHLPFVHASIREHIIVNENDAIYMVH